MIGSELMAHPLLSALWRKAALQEEVHVVVESGELPFIEDPENCTQNSYLAEDQSEAVVLAFLSSECANLYANTLVEMHDELRPSMLAIRTIRFDELFGMVEELGEIAKGSFGSPVRIDLVEQISEDQLLTDTVYSTYVLKS